MTKRKGDAAVTIIIVVVVILIILVSYFMFFRNTNDDNTGNMNNTSNAGTNNGANTGTDNNVDIYGNNNSSITDNIGENITISDENANSFYQRVKKGITLNGKLVEVPTEYMARLTNKIGATGYKLTDEASKTVNAKYDEIEKTLANNNVSDINDLDATTKDKIETLIQDIEDAL